MLPLVTPAGQRIALGDVANIYIEDGPPAIKSENARRNGWTLVDIEGVDLGGYVRAAMSAVRAELDLPPGYSINWSGQYEYLRRAKEKLAYVIPLTLAIIVVLLFMNFRRISEVALLMGTLPFALLGGVWLLYWQGFNFSIAVAVGFIALAGVAVEIGVIMLVYLNQARRRAIADKQRLTRAELRDAIIQGAGLRIRPVMMTAAAITAGLLPVLFGAGAGSQIMSRIAAPMVGGMLSAVPLTLLVLPAVYCLWRQRQCVASGR